MLSSYYKNSSLIGQPDIGREVLILGGAGYVGLAVSAELLSAGYRVTVFDSLVHGTEPLDYIENKKGLSFIRRDVRDIAAVGAAMRGRWAVIFLAALVGENACAQNPEAALETNYLAALNAAERARWEGVSRFVFVSTDSCYGAREGEKLDESSPLRPISLYADLKARAEEKILELPKTPGFSPTVLRLATVYGFSPRPRFDLAVNLLARDMVLKGHARIFSGEQWRPLVHVADVARAFRRALGASADLVEGQIFNVGADEQNIQFKELAKPLMDINPNGYVAFEPATPDLRDYFVKFGKIKSVLGFEPSFSLAEGLADLGEWVKNGVPADPYSPKWRNS